MLIFQFQKGGVFDIRDASVAGCCTFEEGIYFPLLWEQIVLQSRVNSLELLWATGCAAWQDVAGQKDARQSTQSEVDSSVNAEFFCQCRSPSLVGLDLADCVIIIIVLPGFQVLHK